MFAFLGLVKIMHVIRRKWLLSLPVGNSIHGTTALCLIKDRPERAGLRKQVQEHTQRQSTCKSNFCLHLIIIWAREGININHCHLSGYILKLLLESWLNSLNSHPIFIALDLHIDTFSTSEFRLDTFIRKQAKSHLKTLGH